MHIPFVIITKPTNSQPICNGQDATTAINISPARSPRGSEIHAEIFTEVFNSINLLTIERVLELCDKKLNGRSDSEGFGYAYCLLNHEDSKSVDWIVNLNDTDVKKIRKSISDLQIKTPDILASLKPNANRFDEIVVSTLDLGGKNSHQIMAKDGSIYLKAMKGSTSETPLMTLVQFLSSFKSQLNGLDLSDRNLRGADFSGANLRGTILCRSDLRNVDMHKADLSEADMSRASLSRADLQHAILNKTNLHKAILHKAKLEQAALIDADLSGADLSGAFLSWAHLIRTNLNGAKLCGAFLLWADLTGADLSWANLCGADLRAATLEKVKIPGTQFDGDTNLDDTPIKMDLPQVWDQATLGIYLKLLRNTETGNLLTAIDSIDNQLEELKLSLMVQLIESLKEADISKVNKDFMVIFMENPIYVRDKRINLFINDRMAIRKSNVIVT